MTAFTPAPWPRPYFSRSEDRAMLLFFVFGDFAQKLELDAARFGSAGLPRHVEMHRFSKSMLAHWEGHPLRGALGDLLRDDDPGAFKAARAAPECIMLRGELEDQPDLDYLRDTLGVIGALLMAGGIAVVDPQILSLYSARAWGERYLIEGGAPPRHHVLILCHDEDDGSALIRTRGMRKFARPDVCLRGVPQADVDRAGALCEQLVELQVMGARFSDGVAVDVEGLLAKGSLVAHLAGSLDDPQFNNTHVEFAWPL